MLNCTLDVKGIELNYNVAECPHVALIEGYGVCKLPSLNPHI